MNRNRGLHIFLVFIMLFLFNDSIFAIDMQRIDESFKNIFPHKHYEVISDKPNLINDIIDIHFKNSSQLRSLEYQNQSTSYQIRATESLFKPQYQFSMNYNNYNTYHREVMVNARIPVEWDNDNPIITNINLPNGGEGIIWLPRPVGWAWRDIPLNASDFYRDQTMLGNIGVSQRFPFGLQVNALSYSLDYRLNPKTYGFPWSSQLATSFMLPIMKNWGTDGSVEVNAIEKMKIDNEITNESYNSLKKSIKSQIISDYIQLYYTIRQIQIIDSIESVLSVQAQDIDLLTQDGRVTVVENLNMKNSLYSITSQRNSLFNSFIYLNSKLNFNPGFQDTLLIFFPESIELNELVDLAYNYFQEQIAKNDIQQLAKAHPQSIIAEHSLRQIDYDVRYASNQAEPDISITGSIGVFELSRLGFKDPLHSTANLIKPDGVRWNFGVQYTLPTGKYDKIILEANLVRQKAQVESLLETNKSIGNMITDYIFNLENSFDNITNARRDKLTFQNIINKEINPLYELKRINRYDYNTYLRQLQSNDLRIIQSQSQFLSYFFQFAGEMNFDISDVINTIANQ